MVFKLFLQRVEFCHQLPLGCRQSSSCSFFLCVQDPFPPAIVFGHHDFSLSWSAHEAIRPLKAHESFLLHRNLFFWHFNDLCSNLSFFFFLLFFQTQQINCKQSLLPEAAHLHGILNLKLLFRLGFRNDKHQATDGRNKQKEPKRSEIFICRSYKTCFAFNSSQRKPALLLQNFAAAFPGLKEEKKKKNKQKPRRKSRNG